MQDQHTALLESESETSDSRRDIEMEDIFAKHRTSLTSFSCNEVILGKISSNFDNCQTSGGKLWEALCDKTALDHHSWFEAERFRAVDGLAPTF